MSARAFEISLISAAGKQTRTVIEYGSIKAMLTALHTFEEPGSPFALTCAPLCELPDITEERPCAV